MNYEKILVLILALSLVSFSLAIAQVEKADDEETQFRQVPLTKARIAFDHTDYDFGSIAKGSSVTHSYWFANNGTDTLVITKITPTCGCTSTKTGGIVVPPGGRSNIDIVFNSGKFNGKVTKSIKIECNDALSPYLDLRFRATINNPLLTLEYTPLQVDFQTVAKGETKEFTVNITNTDSTESMITLIDIPSENFIITQLSNNKLKPGQTAFLKFSLVKNLEPGPYQTSITVEAEGKHDARISIPILATIGDGGKAE
jgi:hypothetical protein